MTLSSNKVSSPGYRRIARSAVTGKRIQVRLYRTWSDMKIRCYNKNSVNYRRYGARGIRVCQEWHQYEPFRRWAIANGYGKGLTIDRLDCDGNYEPSNCRWATKEQQTYYGNPRTEQITYKGITKPGPVWAKEHGLTPSQFRARLKEGWSVERALTQPLQAKFANSRRNRKLTDDQVRWARTCGLKGTEIAKRLGMSPAYMRSIIRGQNYSDVK